MLNVFYDPRQVADQPGHTSPSSGKPKAVVAEWNRRGFPIKIREISPVTEEDFSLAHDSKFVHDILNCQLENGFGNTNEYVAASLPWTTGSLWSAARAVMTEDISVACSPTSGFHHACWDKCGGFCTFNGLMVTALLLKKHELVNKVGILDLDHHWGNGTADIINALSIDWLYHYTIGGESIKFQQLNALDKTGAEVFMERLPSICAAYQGCDVVLYQAGADLWENDPFAWNGGLSVAQLKKRDEIVFSSFHAMGIPCVWNLAGGYVRDEHGTIQPVLDIHNNTAQACIESYGLNEVESVQW